MADPSRFGVNASYVEALRAQWLVDPSSVADEWRSFFENENGQTAAGNGQGDGNGEPAAAPKGAASKPNTTVSTQRTMEPG